MPTLKSLFHFRAPSSSPRCSPATSRKSSVSHLSLNISSSSSTSDSEKPTHHQQSEELVPSPTLSGEGEESEQQIWQRMLLLQQQYHCYHSARLEAGVEALERGYTIDMIPIPSRACLDLLNEELRAQVEFNMQQDYQ